MGELPRIDASELVSASRYAARGYPFEAWKTLRDRAPVYAVDSPRGRPFWAITRHADITEISRQPALYLNAPRLTVASAQGADLPARMLLNMDPPEHHVFRSLVNKRFTPRAMRGIASGVDEIATGILDAIANDGELGEIDFVERVSALLPIWVIAQMLGVPRSDWDMLFDWTNRTVGAGDPEYQPEGSTGPETMYDAGAEMFEYFARLAEARRREPRDDLASALALATIDGTELPRYELLSYYYLIVVAGNETTRNATSGGLLALIENPDQFDQVRRNPRLLKPLVEEILRWTSPVAHFCRTPARDVELHGQKVLAGESLCLFYPSANRDERVFAEPDEFRVDRQPNRHIAFGVGEHVCLGAHVARLELQVIFRHLIERLEHVELAGPIERLRSHVIGGIKHMPIRYRLSPSPAGRRGSKRQPADG
jgi:cholest-4-en-3-one 26-monooxygenase